MLDDNDVYARTTNGEYHRTICPTVDGEEVEETFGLLPEGVEKTDCESCTTV